MGKKKGCDLARISVTWEAQGMTSEGLEVFGGQLGETMAYELRGIILRNKVWFLQEVPS